MKKILIFLALTTSLIAMDPKGTAIPGTLAPTESHSPSDFSRLSHDSETIDMRRIQFLATKISDAAVEKLFKIYASGKIPGSAEVMEQLNTDQKKSIDEAKSTRGLKKSKSQEDKDQYATYHRSFSIEECVLHVAMVVNANANHP